MSAKSNVEVTFLPLRSKTGASGVFNCQECSQISPGWSGSAGISGGRLLAAAAELDAATSLFVGGVGSIHSLSSMLVRLKSLVIIGSLPSCVILQNGRFSHEDRSRWRSKGLFKSKVFNMSSLASGPTLRKTGPCISE